MEQQCLEGIEVEVDMLGHIRAINSFLQSRDVEIVHFVDEPPSGAPCAGMLSYTIDEGGTAKYSFTINYRRRMPEMDQAGRDRETNFILSAMRDEIEEADCFEPLEA